MHDLLRVHVYICMVSAAKRMKTLFTHMHLKTLPIRFPDGGTFLYKLLPAQNITKKKKENFF